MELKTCRACGQRKSLKDFPTVNKTSHRPDCTLCWRGIKRERYAKAKEEAFALDGYCACGCGQKTGLNGRGWPRKYVDQTHFHNHEDARKSLAAKISAAREAQRVPLAPLRERLLSYKAKYGITWQDLASMSGLEEALMHGILYDQKKQTVDAQVAEGLAVRFSRPPDVPAYWVDRDEIVAEIHEFKNRHNLTVDQVAQILEMDPVNLNSFLYQNVHKKTIGWRVDQMREKMHEAAAVHGWGFDVRGVEHVPLEGLAGTVPREPLADRLRRFRRTYGLQTAQVGPALGLPKSIYNTVVYGKSPNLKRWNASRVLAALNEYQKKHSQRVMLVDSASKRNLESAFDYSKKYDWI